MPSLTTSIASVTAYPDRARMTRRGTLTLEAGVQLLEISELTLSLNPDSLRVAARGTARARLLGAEVKRSYYPSTPAEQVRQLEEQIQALQDDIKRLDTQSELCTKQRASLDQIASHSDTYALALASKELSLEAELAIFDGLRTRAEKLEQELHSLQVERRELERRLEKLTKELEQQRNARPRERYTAIIGVEVLQPGELTVELSYVVGNALWQPLYDLRLMESENGVTLEVSYLGQVKQTTGEPWESVSLTLSTARPALTRTLPELQPWYLRSLPPIPRPAQPVPQPAPRMMKAALVQEAMQTTGSEAVEAEVAQASVETSGATVTYLIPDSVSIPPDGALHKVSVAQFSLPPRLDYVATPKLAEAVYRRVRLTNDSPYTLLPGQASLFAGDEFIGVTPLEMTAPQGEIELFLGVEDRIKIERELKRREVSKQLIVGKRHLAFGYEIRLENLLPGPASLTLRDQIPVSLDENIKVRLESCDPKPSEQSELNLLKWELTLAPKEKRTVRFDFTVETPQGMEISGLS